MRGQLVRGRWCGRNIGEYSKLLLSRDLVVASEVGGVTKEMEHFRENRESSGTALSSAISRPRGIVTSMGHFTLKGASVSVCSLTR